MLDRSGIVKRLTLANISARKALDALKGPELPGLSVFRGCIRQYVLCKFLLEDEGEVQTRDMNELAKLSVEKAGRLNPNELELLDVSKHCGATSSVMTKKVLLYMALSEDIGVDLSRRNTADIEDTDMLADIIYEELSAKRGGALDERV